jgi:hypothetical protein
MHTGLEVILDMDVSVFRWCPLHPPQPLSMIMSPSLLCTLTKLTSPLHSVWHHSCMHVRPIVDALRPIILTFAQRQDSITQGMYRHVLDLVALWLAGRTNPSSSADSCTSRPLLRIGHVSQWPPPLKPLLDGQPDYPDILAPAKPCTDSTCT